MIEIHLICQHQKNWVNLGSNNFETGNWHIIEATAEECKAAGRIYLHEKQDEPAWHGGKITDWRASPESNRIIFSYSVDGNFRVRCAEGWAQEKAIIRR